MPGENLSIIDQETSVAFVIVETAVMFLLAVGVIVTVMIIKWKQRKSVK